MPNNYFKFKAFTILQEDCAMKVCTDSCLFGAWVANYISKADTAPTRILDIGTGTGLLTLMLAQKSRSAIIAVELNGVAAAVAKQNILNAALQNDIEIVATDIVDYKSNTPFDFIISNPPFYDADLKSANTGVNDARHATGLTLEALAEHCATNCSEAGKVALLGPYKREEEFVREMGSKGFSVERICRVRHSAKKPFIRSMFIFTKQPAKLERSEITIRDEQNNYSSTFNYLLADYYLNL